MAWQVAIVVDQGESEEALHANLSILLGRMPVWAVAKYERVPGAAELRNQWGNCWHPEPGLTLVNPLIGLDTVSEVIDLIPTIQEHHSRVCAVRLFGIENSERLADGLAGLGFYLLDGRKRNGIGFARPLSQIKDVPKIRLDAAAWKSRDDFFDAFFEAVGAPDRHGRNFNALYDSIGTGRINKTEVPYRVVIGNAKGMSGDAAALVEELGDLFKHLERNGCPVDLAVEQS